ncbi:MAG: O-antigen ligase family protein, partial [Patescibacteria group bacterium]|nr:O-antigen ligase family protein [Patescibacteria group bacterium]
NKKIRCFGIPFLIIYFFKATAGLWLVFHPGNIISNKFAQLATKSRFATAEMSIKALQEKPILGWGPENFHVVFSKYFDPRFFLQEYGGEVWFDRAHNIIFDTLVISGILGFLAYLIIFLSAFYILWKKYFQTKFDFWISGIFSVLLIAYFVQDLTVFDMVSSYMMLFLVLGFIASIQQFPLGNNTQQTSLKQSESEPSVFLSFIILVIFFICFFKFTIQPFKADTDVVKALKTPNSNERLELYKKTLNTSPLGKYQIRESFADNLMRISKSKDANKIPKDNLIKEFEFLSNELEDSIRESPLCLRSELKLGQMYNTYALFDKSKLSRAEEVLNDALNLSPRNQQVYWALSQTKIYQRDIQAGLSLAEKAVELEPRVKSSHLIVIQIAKLISKDLAQEKANKAIKINPLWEEQIKKLLEDKK